MNQVAGLCSVLCSFQSTMINEVNYSLGRTLTQEMIGAWLDPIISDTKLKLYKSFFYIFKVGKH